MLLRKIKAVGFDVGHTLIKYNNSLNWRSLYRAGLEHATSAADIALSEDIIVSAEEILLKYNTRVNYREWETDSDCIFSEILKGWELQTDLYTLKKGFRLSKKSKLLFFGTKGILRGKLLGFPCATQSSRVLAAALSGTSYIIV